MAKNPLCHYDNKNKRYEMYNKTLDCIEDLVIKVIKEGWSRYSLMEYLMKDKELGGYGYGQSYAYELIRHANNRIEEMIKETAVDVLSKQLVNLEQLYQKQIKKGNDKMALETLKEINKISGLYKENINHTGEVSYNINIGGTDGDDV